MNKEGYRSFEGKDIQPKKAEVETEINQLEALVTEKAVVELRKEPGEKPGQDRSWLTKLTSNPIIRELILAGTIAGSMAGIGGSEVFAAQREKPREPQKAADVLKPRVAKTEQELAKAERKKEIVTFKDLGEAAERLLQLRQKKAQEFRILLWMCGKITALPKEGLKHPVDFDFEGASRRAYEAGLEIKRAAQKIVSGKNSSEEKHAAADLINAIDADFGIGLHGPGILLEDIATFDSGVDVFGIGPLSTWLGANFSKR